VGAKGNSYQGKFSPGSLDYDFVHKELVLLTKSTIAYISAETLLFSQAHKCQGHFERIPQIIFYWRKTMDFIFDLIAALISHDPVIIIVD